VRDPPEQRLGKHLKGVSQYDPNIDIDRAFRNSRLGISGNKGRVPRPIGRLVRHPGGDKANVKPGTTFKMRWAGAGRVTKNWGYRRSIGHLGEDMEARGDRGPGFTISDLRKDTLTRGEDRAKLAFGNRGQIQIDMRDVKAFQGHGLIYRVSSLTKALSYNLRRAHSECEAASRDRTRSYGERVLFRAASLRLVKFTTKGGRTPRQAFANIRRAIANGTLKLNVTNHGGNSAGLGAKLRALGIGFIESRKRDSAGNPIAREALKIRLLDRLVKKRFGLRGELQIVQDLSRQGLITRLRAIHDGVAAAVEFRLRTITGKPAGPVGTRLSAPATPSTAGPAKPAGARPAPAGPSRSGPAGPAGTRPGGSTSASPPSRAPGPAGPRASGPTPPAAGAGGGKPASPGGGGAAGPSGTPGGSPFSPRPGSTSGGIGP
jgi:hypothetical protein